MDFANTRTGESISPITPAIAPLIFMNSRREIPFRRNSSAIVSMGTTASFPLLYPPPFTVSR
jgi:hypothetical protein